MCLSEPHTVHTRTAMGTRVGAFTDDESTSPSTALPPSRSGEHAQLFPDEPPDAQLSRCDMSDGVDVLTGVDCCCRRPTLAAACEVACECTGLSSVCSGHLAKFALAELPGAPPSYREVSKIIVLFDVD